MTGLIYIDTGVGFAAWLMWRGAGKCVLYCSFITRIEYERTFVYRDYLYTHGRLAVYLCRVTVGQYCPL
jgi:hypothetical protein